MFGNNICIFEKFATCKNGDNCTFEHPTLVCDDQNCDIRMCYKKHPQDCLYYTNFNNCKHGEESCKFLHRRNASDLIDIDKYKDLEAKYNAILEDHKILQKRIEVLESNERNNKSECTRTHGDVKRKLDGQEEINNDTEDILTNSSKKNRIDNVTLVSNDKVPQLWPMDVPESDKIKHKEYYMHVESDIVKVQTFINNHKRLTLKSMNAAKQMIKDVGKCAPLNSKRTEIMANIDNDFIATWESTKEDVERKSISNFRQFTLPELQKVIKICKREQIRQL